MSEAIEQHIANRRKQTIERLEERLSEIYALSDSELESEDALEVLERIRKIAYRAIAEESV